MILRFERLQHDTLWPEISLLRMSPRRFNSKSEKDLKLIAHNRYQRSLVYACRGVFTPRS